MMKFAIGHYGRIYGDGECNSREGKEDILSSYKNLYLTHRPYVSGHEANTHPMIYDYY